MNRIFLRFGLGFREGLALPNRRPDWFELMPGVDIRRFFAATFSRQWLAVTNHNGK